MAGVESFGDRLQRFGGVGPGFDLTRLVLASGVMVWHTVPIAGGSVTPAKATPFWLAGYAFVPMFFALSGFLVTASACRLPWRPFLTNRAVRILPALAAVTLLAMLAIGPAVTRVPPSAYFSARGFWTYGLNAVGVPHFLLPGVFETNAYPGAVNGSLWTVPYEIGCYLILAALIFAGHVRRAGVLGGLALAWVLAACLVRSAGLEAGFGRANGAVHALLFAEGAKIIPFFLTGAVLYLARDRVRYDARIAAGLAAGLVVVALAVPGTVAASPWLTLGACGPMAYLVAWAGLTPMPRLPVFGRADYSYGIYLWHFPVLQVLGLVTGVAVWWQLTLLALVPVTLCAMGSWHLVERPALALRKRFSIVGARIAAEQRQAALPSGERVQQPL